MKKNHIYGIAAIVLGGLLFLPLALNAFQMSYADFSEGNSFFYILGNAESGMPGWATMTLLTAIVGIIAAALLIIVGIMLVANFKADLLMGKIFLFGVTAIGATVLLFGLITGIMYWADDMNTAPISFGPGAGMWILWVLSIFTIACPWVLKFLVKKN